MVGTTITSPVLTIKQAGIYLRPDLADDPEAAERAITRLIDAKKKITPLTYGPRRLVHQAELHRFLACEMGWPEGER